MSKTFHSGSITKSVVITSSNSAMWRTISDITAVTKWAAGVKKCSFMTRVRRGIGAVRNIEFEDGNKIEEHVVAWNTGKSFTYVAVSGLPLRAYVATISLKKISGNRTKVTWESYLNSCKMTERQFEEFLTTMGEFYEISLDNLKKLLVQKR